jgi:hypothetical protein
MWRGHSMSRRQPSAGWQAPKSLAEQGERSVSNLSRTLYMVTLLALVPSMAKAEVLTEWIQLTPGHWKPIYYERFAHLAEFKPAPHLMRPKGLIKWAPPVEFDKPFTGKLTIERVESAEAVALICNLKRSALACAFAVPDQSRCRIVIAPEELIKAAGYTQDMVLRHEQGHCNSWPADHRGQRAL